MELMKRPAPREEFSAEFKREFVEKIVIMDKTLGDLARELGIPPQTMRKWTLTGEPDETMAWKIGEPLKPAIRILELEHDMMELKRQIQHQAITIQILENNRTADVGSTARFES